MVLRDKTIRKEVEIEGKFVRQSGGRGQYGHVWLKLQPLEQCIVLDFLRGEKLVSPR